jgi:hypothetical protein
MNRAQFGFLVGLLLAWIWAGHGFLTALAAAVAGAVGYVVSRAIAGELDIGALAERVTAGRR